MISLRATKNLTVMLDSLLIKNNVEVLEGFMAFAGRYNIIIINIIMGLS